VQLTWFNEWVTAGLSESKPATEVLDAFQNRLHFFRGMGGNTWFPDMAKVSKCVVRESQ
jgi:hypothetical protein